jgi:hypothetical protein
MLTCLAASAFAQVIVADHDANLLADKINTAVHWHCIPKSVFDAWSARASTLIAALNAEIAAAQSALPTVQEEQPESDFGKKRQAKHVDALRTEIETDYIARANLQAAIQSASQHICPPEDEHASWTGGWLGGSYVALEAGGGWNKYSVVPGGGAPDPNVNAGGFGGGGAVGFRVPVNGVPDSLVWPVGARIGVLGGSFNGSAAGYTVKMPVAFYGEAEFANTVINSVVGSIAPQNPVKVYSSAGVAGVLQNYGWTMPAAGGNTNALQFAFTTSIRAEWPITRSVDMYVQWRTFLITPVSVGLPGPATVSGYSNIFTLGVQF